MRKVQFKAADLKLGLTQTTGFLWADQHGIHFEYQVSDSILEVFKSGISEVTLSYDQVEDVLHSTSWFGGGKILIHLNSLKNVDKIPFLKSTIISIPLKRKQKENGLNFAVDAKYELSNHHLNKLDGL